MVEVAWCKLEDDGPWLPRPRLGERDSDREAVVWTVEGVVEEEDVSIDAEGRRLALHKTEMKEWNIPINLK